MRLYSSGMIRECDACGASIPKTARRCPSCGEGPAPVAVAAAVPCGRCGRPVAAQAKACLICGAPNTGDGAPIDTPEDVEAAREIAAETARKLKAADLLRIAEALLFVLAVPVLLPGFAITALMVRRWGRVPLSLVVVEGVLLTGLSYLGFESGDGPLAGLVFPLLLLSCFACAGLFVLRSWKGKLQGGMLLGYSGLVTLLMMVGGGFLYAGAGLVVHRARAANFLPVVSDVPLTLSPADALRRPERLVHLILQDARLDVEKAARRVVGGGIDVYCAAGAEGEEPRPAEAIDLFQQASTLLGTRVQLSGALTPGQGKWIADEWREQIRSAGAGGQGRYWCRAAGTGSDVVFQSTIRVPADDPRTMLELLQPEDPVGFLAEIPGELLESTNGLDVRGRQPGQAKGLVLIPEASPSRWCAPVEGTSGALWVLAEGELPPAEGAPLQGVLEWPEEGAGRALAALARRQLGAAKTLRPRVLALGSTAAYRNANGLTTEAAEGTPLAHWGALLLGLALTAAGVTLSLRE